MAHQFKLLGLSALVLGLALSGAARAQNFNDYLNRKYAIQQEQQQQAENDRKKAEAERIRAETEARSAAYATNSGRTNYSVPRVTDDFAGQKVPKYRLPNGVTLQASGGFHPSEEVRCTSDCFVPLNPRY